MAVAILSWGSGGMADRLQLLLADYLGVTPLVDRYV